MPYIGNTPADKFLTLAKQSFSTSATTSYTLDSSISSTQDIALFINNVRQSPVDAYTVSGTALTLTSATAGTDEMYCVYLGKTVGTVSPSVNSITNAMMTDDSVGIAELSATGTASSSNYLRGDNSWATAGESNTPYFLAYTASSTQSVAHDTWTTVACANALLNDGSDFNTSTYTFTPQVAGKYFLFAAASWNGDGGTNSQYTIKKNNTESVTTQRILKIYSDSNARGGNINAFFEANGSSDYFTFQAYQSSGGAKNLLGTNGGENNYFGGFLVST